MEKIIVLSGAGISAESGLKTFRDAGGLWEGHDVMAVASPQGWENDPQLVLDFYNKRRRQLREVEPNPAHEALVELEPHYDVCVITQNVDDLHERAGSRKVLHLHGELTKCRSSRDESLVYDYEKDIKLGDSCELGSQLRPHVVWFGEMVPMLPRAQREMLDADHVIIVGTSLQVYPAAGLVGFAPEDSGIYYIDPNPSSSPELSTSQNLEVIPEKASTGVRKVVDRLIPDG
ncbi:MAG: NAD-dependent deacylase [Saprospiraceae bacterium]|nr:NAD-dependent deacylase [Saprospiraceae bacterium]